MGAVTSHYHSSFNINLSFDFRRFAFLRTFCILVLLNAQLFYFYNVNWNLCFMFMYETNKNVRHNDLLFTFHVSLETCQCQNWWDLLCLCIHKIFPPFITCFICLYSKIILRQKSMVNKNIKRGWFYCVSWFLSFLASKNIILSQSVTVHFKNL